ncbi:hypothetical protein [Rubrivirga sp.]|uniref:hypothetical protein n=1 Tax=Rubrivirga sp. TaxID=1885344 RepID=UPI003B51FF33
MPPPESPSTCGTVAPTTEAVLDAVREMNGRRALRPARTVRDAAREVEGFLVVPEWYAGERASDVAADLLRSVYGVEPSASPYLWALYAEGARRLGFTGAVPVPVLPAGGTARPAEA